MRAVAVCCGFNDYDVNPLALAVNDAALLYARLTESTAFNGARDLIGRGELFTQKTPASVILAALTRAASSTAELVWFSFSGHAIVSGSGELRLLLPGWRRGSPDDEPRYSIGAGEIESVLRSRLASKRFVVVLDTCHSGAFGGSRTSRDIHAALEEQIASAGAVVISSCARDQLAYDGRPASGERNGAFTAAVIQVLDDYVSTGAPLSVLTLFRETRARLHNGQIPTLYVNGFTEDFSILGSAGPTAPGDGIVPLSAEVPATLADELSAFLTSVVQIRRRRRVGLIRAKRKLESLAAEFYRYGDDTFIVPGHNANVIEAFAAARTCIIGCTTPAYAEEWRRSGSSLLAANREFIARQGGRVVRLFFVRNGFEDQIPGVLDLVRDHVAAGVHAVVVNVDLFGPAVRKEVFRDPRPHDLGALECAFVDGKIFLRTHFAAHGDLKIEIDQRPARCQHEYKTQLRPLLSASEGALWGAWLRDGRDSLELDPLASDDVAELRRELEIDLGIAADGTGLAITPGGARARAGGWRAAGCRRPNRPGRG